MLWMVPPYLLQNHLLAFVDEGLQVFWMIARTTILASLFWCSLSFVWCACFALMSYLAVLIHHVAISVCTPSVPVVDMLCIMSSYRLTVTTLMPLCGSTNLVSPYRRNYSISSESCCIGMKSVFCFFYRQAG